MSTAGSREQRLNRIGTGVVLSLIVSGLVFAATRADGFKASKVKLHDSGIWLVKADVIGRFNHDLQKVDTQSPTFGESGIDLQQVDATVIVTTQNPPAMHRYDVALNSQIGTAAGTLLPDHAVVSIGGDNGALLDTDTGRLWFTSNEAVAGVKTTDDKAFVKLKDAQQVVVGTDGVAHVFAPKSGTIWTLHDIIKLADPLASTTGLGANSVPSSLAVAVPQTADTLAAGPDAPQPNVIEAAKGDFALSAAGDRGVLLDATGHRLVLDDGTTIDVPQADSGSRLQLPGDDRSHVVISTEKSVLLVDLVSHRVSVLGPDGVADTQGDGNPLAPVWLKGCASAAWASRAVRYCPNRPSLDDVAKPTPTPDSPLKFRVNRGLVALNYVSGASLDMSDDGPLNFTNDWSSALQPNLKEQQDQIVPNESDQVDKCSFDPQNQKPNSPPKAVPDVFGVRRSTPTVLDVLSGVGSAERPDTDADCDVLTVGLDTTLAGGGGALPDNGGTIAVIKNGRALQYEPPSTGSAPATITFTYLLSDGRSDPVPGSVTLNVIDDATNTAPVPANDSTSVAQGKNVQLNVLANDYDPEGDPLVVTAASILDAAGAPAGLNGPDGDSLVWQADGRISYKAPPSLTKTEKLSYTVSDGRGESTAVVEIAVIPGGSGQNKPPNTVNDAVIGLAGQNLSVDVLANDSDPNNDELRLLQVVPVDANTTVVPNAQDPSRPGVVTLAAAQEGTYNYAYQVDDGNGGSAWGRLRFTVLPVTQNHAPVAVRDDAVVGKGRPAVVDVLGNDTDLDGDVLMITEVVPDKNTAGVYSSDGLSVEVLDHRVLRVTTKSAARAGDTYVFHYRVSDAQAEALATVTVRVVQGSVGQAPVTGDDKASVHLGGLVGIPVLVNDYNPDGGQLKIVPGSAVITSVHDHPGELFVEGDTLVYVAPTIDVQPAGFTVRGTYTVTDGTRSATGNITIDVHDLSANAAPAPVDLLVRVFTDDKGVEIPLPRYGLDPDGDPVEIGEQVPVDGEHHGTVRVDKAKGLFVYDAGSKPGQDVFRWELQDSPASGESKTGVITVRVVVSKRANNAPPVAVDDTFEAIAGQDTPLAVTANDTDPDGDPIVLADGHSLDQPVANGTVSVGDPTHVVFSATGKVGDTADFSYYISDGRGNAPVVGTVHVKIVEKITNQPPVAKNDPQPGHRAGESWNVDVLANDKDAENDPLFPFCPAGSNTFCTETTVTRADGTQVKGLKLTMPEAPLSFAYLLTDADHPDTAHGATRAVVQVPLVKNRAPVCSELPPFPIKATDPDTVTITLDIAAQCKDPDPGDTVSLWRETQPVAAISPQLIVGPLKWNDGSTAFNLSRDPSVSGDVEIDYQVRDSQNAQTTAKLIVQITGHTNVPPQTKVIQKNVESGTQAITIDLRALAVTDPDPGDVGLLQFSGGASPDASLMSSSLSPVGLLTINVPNETAVTDQTGPKTLTVPYTVDDTHPGGTATGQVQITVTPSNKPGPNAQGDSMGAVKQGSTGSVNVLANDVASDPKLAPLVVVTNDVQAISNGAVAGQVHITPSGAAVFTPQPGFHGTAKFSYSVQDARHTPTKQGNADVTVDVQDKPDRPAQPSVGDQQSAAAVVTFAATPDNGSPITKYVVTWSGGSKDCGTAAGSCTVTGLKNGTAYQFQVTATNAVGTSDLSDLSQPYSPDQVPDQPPQPTAVWGDKQVTVNWANITNPGSPLVGVRIDTSPSGQGSSFTAEGTASGSHVFTNLQNGTPYTFTVTAINGAKPNGQSASSSPSIAVIPAGDPGNVNPALAKGDGQVTASWAPADPNGDAPGLTYTVLLMNGNTVERTDGPLTATSKTVPATNGQTYTVKVQINNKYTLRTGTPIVSASSPAIRPAGKPKPPADIAVTQNQDGAVKIHIGATNFNGDPLEYYTVTSSGGGSKQFPADPNGAAADVVYPGLTNGSSYTFTVTAHNLDGDSLPTGPSSAGVPFGTPAVPTAECHHNGSYVTCTWSFNNLNGPGPAAQTVTIDGAAVPNTGVWNSSSLPYSTPKTLVVQVCNNGTNGPAGAQKCSSVTKADTTNGPPTPHASCSPSGRTINCSWYVDGAFVSTDPHTSTVDVNGTIISNQDSGTWGSGDIGYSAGRTLTFRLCNSSGQCTAAAQGATTDAPPRVVQSSRASLYNACQVGGGTCYYISLSISGFSPGPHTFNCFNGQTIQSRTWFGTITADGNGNGSISTQNTDPYCAAANKSAAGMSVDGVGDSGANW